MTVLFEWHVNFRPRRNTGAPLPHITRHPHDGHKLGTIEPTLNSLPDGVLVRERFLRKRLVYDGDERCVYRIAFVEVAPAEKRNSHRAEVSRRRHRKYGLRRTVSQFLPTGAPLDPVGAC